MTQPIVKSFLARTISGKEFSLDANEAKRLMTRFKGARAGSWWEITTGPHIGTIIALQHIEYITPKRSDKEEKAAIKAQKDEYKARLIRVANAKDKQTSLDNKDNAAIDACDVLHSVQNVVNKEGDHEFVVDTSNIVPRYEISEQGDIKRFFPVCKKCNWRGQLIKGTLIQKIWGIAPEEVIPYGE